MPPSAAVVVPTRHRASYLGVALGSIAPQAAAAGAELVVVLDGPDAQSAAVAAEHGARVVAHDRPRGLNAARNTGVDATTGELVCFVDDDVEARPGWLAALVAAAAAEPEADVFTGPMHVRLEDHRFRMCGREGPPITFLDLGPVDADARHAWGANMAIRRSAFARVGPFDASRELYGDEQEWQDRLRASERPRIRYVAAAALDHRRAGEDARLRALARAAYGRGRASRRFDVFKGTPPSLAGELRTLAATALHGPRFLCANGPVMAAHSAGRVREALRPAPDPAAPDFLSGRSGVAAGRRAVLRAAADRVLDVLDTPLRLRLARAARRTPPRQRVLVLALVRPEHAGLWAAAERELRRSRHEVEIVTAAPGGAGKFENLNALLEVKPWAERDWLLVVDDDVVLPRGLLDGLLHVAAQLDLRLAQPAHRLAGHAAWPVTRRRPLTTARETAFVEIGPVTLFHRATFPVLLPFPPLRMGWGLDVHWAALARVRGWRLGVVDALPVLHAAAPPAASYPRAAAEAEARAFLEARAYLPRDEADRTLATHR